MRTPAGSPVSLLRCLPLQVAICVFLLGSVVAGYRRVPPGGSPLTRMFRVLCGTCAHRKAAVPDKEGELHEVEGDMSCIPGQAKLGRCVGAGRRNMQHALRGPTLPAEVRQPGCMPCHAERCRTN